MLTNDELENFLDGVHELGIPYNNEPNHGVATGASVIPSSLSAENQSRSDARTAYLDPVVSRPNLHVLTNYTVTRIDAPFQNSTYIPGISGTLVRGVEVSDIELIFGRVRLLITHVFCSSPLP
jgi:choline dehydrogenase